VTLVATSVAHPRSMSARRTFTVTEPAAPPPSALAASLGSVALSEGANVATVDLRAAFVDPTLRGMTFAIAGNPFGSAAIDPDGHTLRVTGAFRGAAVGPYAVTVLATTVPYGATTPDALPLLVSESDPAPVRVTPARLASLSPPQPRASLDSPLLVAATRADGNQVRVALEPRVDAFGPLAFSLVGVSPASASYDSVYVDPGQNDLVIEGIDVLDVTYTATVLATDVFGQSVELDVVVHNVVPPAPIDPATPVTYVMPPYRRPLVLGDLASFFTTTAPTPLSSFAISTEPCDYPARATYSASSRSITVTAAPATIRLTAFDELGQASTSPKTIQVL